MAITNRELAKHDFLHEMYNDPYFPNDLVDQGVVLLKYLCERIEEGSPPNQACVLDLTHATTRAFNDLGREFLERGSEIETVARDCIGMDIDFILRAYGYDIDIEEAIAPREW